VRDRSWRPGRRPGEILAAGPLTLRRLSLDDLEPLLQEIERSRDHLAAWQDWARTTDRATLRGFLLFAEAAWNGRTDFQYAMIDAEQRIVGGAGLHARLGPGMMEIGYWVGEPFINRGYATAAAAALTQAAFQLGGVRQVEIRCDQANVRSAAVPRKLGYNLERIDKGSPDAPADSGRSMIWVLERR
jgi:RimJ/RimL family protein N-acetyltransferase